MRFGIYENKYGASYRNRILKTQVISRTLCHYVRRLTSELRGRVARNQKVMCEVWQMLGHAVAAFKLQGPWYHYEDDNVEQRSFLVYNWYRRQFILFVCPHVVLWAFQIRCHLERSSAILDSHLGTSVLTFCGRLWPLGCLLFCLSCPFRFFFLRVSNLSFVFPFFPISNLVNLYCPPFNEPQSNNQHEYCNSFSHLFSVFITAPRCGTSSLTNCQNSCYFCRTEHLSPYWFWSECSSKRNIFLAVSITAERMLWKRQQ